MKLKFAAAALALGLLAPGAYAQEQEQETAPGLESVLVVGQRPGPGLWKVSKDDHVMYVFGKYGPLPKKMEWRSHEVEAILAKSQEYLSEPALDAKLGFWGGVKLAASIPQMLSFQENPDGAMLQDVVPPEVYARWLVLKEKYLGDNQKVEKFRPIFASATLFKAVLERAGLTSKDQIDGTLQKLAKRSNVKVTPALVETALPDAGQLLKDFKSGKLDDAECFSATLAQLEADIDQMRVRANAWAVGDIDTIRKLSFADREGACYAAVVGSTAFQARPELVAMRAKARALWLENAEKALASNATTFAVLRMNEIMSPHGLIAALQAKGYKLESPE
ncbi:TraB/GumN family protein [Pseudoduganella sp. DS3]|uniref:TraB/GumN family protein n=1 Tax=Pseudoduganella guangdongensis TaxID=2692179 RepID=A0A6N9HB21_9BURK|nr:TraB/GumN family protein [Pseudoduganella guangdongensis]MYN00626.1 TraB/GumN family protein [Pseudoduganella guangdongensis]